MTEPENLVLVHLRELRAQMDARFDAVEARLTAMDKRLDAMHLNGMKALRGFIGHRTMVERTIASFEDEITQLKQRVDELEARP
ncbi:MAG TPA: hypothetical protein VF744_06830 [Beijerinckiaceae bacterium]|jgi:hypothetical protein